MAEIGNIFGDMFSGSSGNEKASERDLVITEAVLELNKLRKEATARAAGAAAKDRQRMTAIYDSRAVAYGCAIELLIGMRR